MAKRIGKVVEMKDGQNKFNREEAADYWDTYEIDEHDEGEEVDVEVKRPLSVILSIRLDEQHLRKLKSLARSQDTGVTTLARRILNRCLDQPLDQGLPDAPTKESVRKAVREAVGSAHSLPGKTETEYFVLSGDDLSQIGDLINKTSLRLFTEALKQTSRTVTQQGGELFDKIRDLEKVRG